MGFSLGSIMGRQNRAKSTIFVMSMMVKNDDSEDFCKFNDSSRTCGGGESDCVEDIGVFDAVVMLQWCCGDETVLLCLREVKKWCKMRNRQWKWLWLAANHSRSPPNMSQRYRPTVARIAAPQQQFLLLLRWFRVDDDGHFWPSLARWRLQRHKAQLKCVNILLISRRVKAHK